MPFANVLYGHHRPSFMAITSGFISNLVAVTFVRCTPESLIHYQCVIMRTLRFLWILHKIIIKQDESIENLTNKFITKDNTTDDIWKTLKMRIN